MKRLVAIVLPLVGVAALAELLAGTAQEGAKPKQGEKSVKDLVEELSKAGRVDRAGQALMRDQAQVDARLWELNHVRSQIIAEPDYKKAHEVMQQPRVSSELGRISGLPAPKQREALEKLCKDNMIAGVDALRHGETLMTINEEIAEGEKLKKEILADYQKLEKGFEGEWRVRIRFVRDSTIADIRRDREGRKKDEKPGPTSPSSPQDLDFLKRYKNAGK